MAVRVRVANLPPEEEEETVRRLFSHYAGVRSVHFVCSGPREGYCTVDLREQSVGERAVRELDGRYCRGRLLSVEIVERGSSVGGGDAVVRIVRSVA